jgi:hypothetical protein
MFNLLIQQVNNLAKDDSFTPVLNKLVTLGYPYPHTSSYSQHIPGRSGYRQLILSWSYPPNHTLTMKIVVNDIENGDPTITCTRCNVESTYSLEELPFL